MDKDDRARSQQRNLALEDVDFPYRYRTTSETGAREPEILPPTTPSRGVHNKTTRQELTMSDDDMRPMVAPSRTNSLRFQRQQEDRYEQLRMKNSVRFPSMSPKMQTQESQIRSMARFNKYLSICGSSQLSSESSDNGSVIGIITEELYDRNGARVRADELTLSKQSLAKKNGANRHTLDNKRGALYRQPPDDERSRISSIVPPPPVLQQQSRFSQPGAFRVSAAGRPQSSDIDSVADTVTYRTHQQNAQAPVNFEDETDDECPTQPTPLNPSTSIGTHLTATTAITANPMSIVEALPVDKHHTLREFFDNGKVKFVICLLVSFFLLLVLGAAYWLMGFGVNERMDQVDLVEATLPPTLPGDLDLNFFTRVALPEYTKSALRKANSPQSKALAWLKKNSLLKTYSLNQRLQRFSLACFYFATGGDRRWKKNDGWLSDTDECTWYNTAAPDDSSCHNGILTELSIRENNLIGKIPMEISLLSTLQVLELSRNQLTGSIPSSITDIYALQEIHLFDNYLSGEIPDSIENLEDLEILDLAYNFLTNSLPSGISQLTNLKELQVDRNLLVGKLPTSLGQLSNLEVLYLFANAFEGPIPSGLKRMTSITYLGIDANYLGGSLPSVFGLLTNLKELTLGNNTLDGTVPTELYKTCKNLQVLDVFGNSLSGTLASEVGMLINANALFYEANNLHGSIPSEIGNLRDLETLWLQNNEFRGLIPSEIGRIRRLRDLNLSGNGFIGSLPTTIGLLKDAEFLSFSSNSLEGSIPTEIGLLLKIRRLAFEKTNLTGTVPTELCDLVYSGLLPAYNLTVECSLVECACCEDCLASEIQNSV